MCLPRFNIYIYLSIIKLTQGIFIKYKAYRRITADVFVYNLPYLLSINLTSSFKLTFNTRSFL